MFSCTQCENKYTLDDIKEGNYFVSTGVCNNCYMRMSNSKISCFGKSRIYNPNSIACGQECNDALICRAYIKHRKEF